MIKKLVKIIIIKSPLLGGSSFAQFFFEQLAKILVAFVLFAGGIALLFLRIPGWSIILGLPAVQIGLIFLIFCFDGVAKKRFSPENFRVVNCKFCHRVMMVPPWESEGVCDRCQKKMAEKLKKKSITSS